MHYVQSCRHDKNQPFTGINLIHLKDTNTLFLIMTDLQIAKKVKLKHINEIAEKFGINPDLIEMYGKDKAKIPLSFINRTKAKKSNLILVSAISPTPSGEEKTTMSIELSEALNRLNKKQPLS
jgi:formate--tetrahydrofolate ligase